MNGGGGAEGVGAPGASHQVTERARGEGVGGTGVADLCYVEPAEKKEGGGRKEAGVRAAASALPRRPLPRRPGQRAKVQAGGPSGGWRSPGCDSPVRRGVLPGSWAAWAPASRSPLRLPRGVGARGGPVPGDRQGGGRRAGRRPQGASALREASPGPAAGAGKGAGAARGGGRRPLGAEPVAAASPAPPQGALGSHCPGADRLLWLCVRVCERV